MDSVHQESIVIGSAAAAASLNDVSEKSIASSILYFLNPFSMSLVLFVSVMTAKFLAEVCFFLLSYHHFLIFFSWFSALASLSLHPYIYIYVYINLSIQLHFMINVEVLIDIKLFDHVSEYICCCY